MVLLLLETCIRTFDGTQHDVSMTQTQCRSQCGDPILSRGHGWLIVAAIQLVRQVTACDRSNPLGMINGDIKDWQLSASSTLPTSSESASTFPCHERFARLYQPNGWSWCAKYKTSSEWLQVDMGVVAKVTGILIQGRGDGKEWVTAFLISYSVDAFTWKYAGDIQGNKRIFDGNIDSYGIQVAYLSEPLVTRFIRIHTYSWHEHPSMRIEVIGCQPCKLMVTLPTSVKMSASSEQPTSGGSSCRAEDGLLMTGKAWCAKTNDANQWLQFDIGPPSVVTGVVTMGRGDSGRQQWVTRYRLAYSNDSILWKFYSDATHLEPKEFGGNVNADLERWHFINSPFAARFVRLYPLEWSGHISLRAGLTGCRYKGKCIGEFTRINTFAPCVENLAYQRPMWINSYRLSHKKRRHASHASWRRANTNSDFTEFASRLDDVNGSPTNGCIALSSAFVDKPALRVDLGRRALVSSIVVTAMTSFGKRDLLLPTGVSGNGSLSSVVLALEQRDGDMKLRATDGGEMPRDFTTVNKLAVYVSNDVLSVDSLTKATRCGTSPDDAIKTTPPSSQSVTSSLVKTRLNIQCSGQGIGRNEGRYVYIQAIGPKRRRAESGQNRKQRSRFDVVMCDLTVF